MDRVRKLLNVDFLQSKGYLGKNSVTAVLDTGIYPHQDIEGKIIDFADFVNHRKHTYDDNGHGTHVAGIIAGSGKCSKGRYKGIAPESKIIALKCLDESGNGRKRIRVREPEARPRGLLGQLRRVPVPDVHGGQPLSRLAAVIDRCCRHAAAAGLADLHPRSEKLKQ